MRLPAIAMAPAFACGIALGRHPVVVVPYVTSVFLLSACLLSGVALILTGLTLAKTERILRTDREGAVHVLTDGQELEIRCFVACPGAENTASNRTEMPNQKQSGEKK